MLTAALNQTNILMNCLVQSPFVPGVEIPSMQALKPRLSKE